MEHRISVRDTKGNMKFIFFSFFFLSRNTPPYFCYAAGKRHTFRTRLSEAGVADDIAKRLGGWTEDATAALYDHADRIPEIRAALESAK